MAAAGLWLGLFPTILSLLISFTLGGLIGVLLIIMKIKSRKDYIPFGPFLIAGMVISYFFYVEFITIYLNLVI